MAVYKVPQDVEADDKLIGPFNFRQFIYLLIVSASFGIAWLFFNILPIMAVIPLPVILFFGALALPLRKDQPMEIYMAALVSFYLKPRRRIWEPDGLDNLIEIIAPKIVEVQRTKNLSVNEAERRLSYLAEIVDSRGWAVRSPGGVQLPNSAMNSDVYFEAQQVDDVLDNDSAMVRQISNKLAESDNKRHQDAINIMQNKAPAAPIPIPIPIPKPLSAEERIKLEYNPYPSEIHQTVVQPLFNNQAPVEQIKPEPNTSKDTVSADIMNLANNTSLSIETIAHEAERIKKRQEASEEVVISLR